MSKNLLLDENGDLALQGGQLVLVDSLAQRLRVRLRWFKGECVRAPNGGTPYAEAVLGLAYDASTVQHALTPIILETEGVARLDSFGSTFDQLLRKVFVSFSVVDAGGTTVQVEAAL